MLHAATEALAKAKTILLLDHPFYASLLYRLPLVPRRGIGTMATDGVNIFYDPDFVLSITTPETVGALAHEVIHPAFRHHLRRGNRDRSLWNMAADYAINPILMDAGFQLPKGALFDPLYRGKSAEEIYQILEREQGQPQSNSGGGQNQPSSGNGQQDQSSGGGGQQDQPSSDEQPIPESEGGFGQVLDMPNPDGEDTPLSEAQMREQEQVWTTALQQATLTGRMAGRLPAGVQRAAEAAVAARVNWEEHLRRTFAQTVISDFSWARPNRRYVHRGLYLPGTVKDGVGEVVVAVDCSGSITPRVLGLFQSALSSLVEEQRPERVHVLYFDEVVHKHDTFAAGEEITLTPMGGGGTSFVPIFTAVDDAGIQPQAVIVLTDLMGRFPEQEPGYPVIWVSIASWAKRAPFGETVYMGAA